MSSDLTDEQLRVIYSWIDAIPLSRPKRNIARDFSDGVMLAELVAAYFPQLVEVHNYPAANSLKQKIYNHETLNKRVLRKFGYVIPKNTIEDIANCRTGAIEGVLNVLQFKMAKYREKTTDAESPTGKDSKVSKQPSQQPQPQNNYAHPEEKQNHQSKPVSKAPLNSNAIVPVAVIEDEILFEKEQQIRELQETVEILELKIAKLEQLVRLKDNKIQMLMNK
jgi:hypothetical protein